VYDHSKGEESGGQKATYKLISNRLESNLEVITSEYKNIRKIRESDYQVQKDEHTLHAGKWDWNSYVLKGYRQAEFASVAPRTVEILESIPGFMTKLPFSYTFFSTLKGQSSIASHYGPCNLRIRCHFPLIVPESEMQGAGKELGMEVGGHQIQWKKGKAVFFDDSYAHSVWNHTTEDRVVLLFDMWHPDLHQEEVDAVTELFAYARQQYSPKQK
jgi:aspartate beta-hydroxylase